MSPTEPMNPTPEQVREALDGIRDVADFLAGLGAPEERRKEWAACATGMPGALLGYLCVLESAPAPPPVEAKGAAVEEALRRMEDWLPIEADVDFATLRAALASLRSQVAAAENRGFRAAAEWLGGIPGEALVNLNAVGCLGAAKALRAEADRREASDE